MFSLCLYNDLLIVTMELVEQNCDENPTFFDEKSQRRLAAIDSALDRLNTLAKAIRTASIKRQQQDLIEFTSEEDKNFHKMINIYIKREYKDARPSLREYMGACIAAQRRALMQKSRHAYKMKASRTTRPSHDQKIEQRSKSSKEIKDANLLPRKDKLRKPLSVTGSKATQASKMDMGVFFQVLPGTPPQPTLSIRSSGSLRNEDSMKAKYPDIPRTKPSERHVPCPYCLEPLEVAKLKSKASEYWR